VLDHVHRNPQGNDKSIEIEVSGKKWIRRDVVRHEAP
jgi:hypothetical protein